MSEVKSPESKPEKPAKPAKPDAVAAKAPVVPVTPATEPDTDRSAELWNVYGRRCLAAVDVLKERCRQVEDEGHSTERDDTYIAHELPAAAICYALQASSLPAHRAMFSWPFCVKTFKPTTPRASLVKAAALLLAEIERLDRAEQLAD